MFFRPRFWPTVIMLPALAILLALGSWQLDRREWKHDLIADLATQQAEPPVPLPEQIDPNALAFRRLALSGTLLHERELYWASRTRDGANGYHVVTPLRLEDGREILLDRGWLSEADLDPAGRQAAQPEGPLEIVATARRGGWGGPEWAAWLRPVNDPAGNRWLWPDLEEMVGAAGLMQPVTEVYAAVEPGELPAPPQARPAEPELRDNHLQYALFWFTMAATLLVIYVLFHRRPRGGRTPE